MHATNAPSVSAINPGLRFGPVIFAGVFIFAMAATARGQATTPKPSTNMKQPHWHNYVNRQYGFSFSYPDQYVPVPHPEENGRYANGLFLLEQRDNPYAKIFVFIEVQQFQLRRDRGGNLPVRKPIGRHVFYFLHGGSMGVGFVDEYRVNLKGKTLEFLFDADTQPHLEPKILKTFRTF
jgi:hypothetical protein